MFKLLPKLALIKLSSPKFRTVGPFYGQQDYGFYFGSI